MPFWVAPTDPRVTPGTEIQLHPGPTHVQYPDGLVGDVLETVDGRVIVQQPTVDGTVRTWVWANYPGMLQQYEAQYQLLASFRSRYRLEAGLSPYVWVKEDVTSQLRRRTTLQATLAGTGHSTTTFAWPGGGLAVNALAGGTVEIKPAALGGSGTGAYQVRTILSNTATTVTIRGTWATVPNGAAVAVSYWVADWFRVRVIDVSRGLRADGGNVRYDTTKFAWVIEDSAWNHLG